MRIGFIGVGNIGGTLARHLTKLGHQVWIANSRGPESLTALAAEFGRALLSDDNFLLPSAARRIRVIKKPKR
jgi:predicted dinucleotide-binding enzyme